MEGRDEYLTPAQVADLLPGVTVWWVRDQLASGRLRGSKVGARWFIPAAAVDEMMAAASNQIQPRHRRRRQRSRAP